MLEALRRDYSVEAQGGQAHLADSIIRVGHMGWVHEPEMRQAITAITAVSASLGAENRGSTVTVARDARSAPA
jgi:aspartate aminotransferase-like enzyme